ncbi:hypothetical protein K440DRAFT_263024 [Wilcoxina mikolae CBS 423.85]|nr:hypothetical protein K440DRAFT_263024 [Wilcoxina mikolae CBS 423.85]
MDTSRPDRIRRRTSDGTNRRPGRRASEACEEEQPAARRLRGSVIAPPIITVRANVERNRVPEPSPRLPPEDTRAQIVNLETQIERLQLRLLENRLLENREEARRSRLRADLSSDPTRPLPLFSSDRNSMPPRVPGSDDASSRGGGVRLSSSTAEGANGSAHNEEDERMRRSIRQRLGELARDPQVEPSPQPPMFPPSLSPPSRTNRAAVADENPFRRNMFRRRNSLADSTAGDPWTEPIRNNRGLWRLEDSNLQDGDSDMESLHSSEPRRQLFEAHRAAHYARSPPETTPSNPAAARERFRAIWGDIDTEDYVSPITSL